MRTKPWKTHYFVHCTLENSGIFMKKTLENSEKHPGKPFKTQEFKLKICVATLIFNVRLTIL